MEEKRIDKQHIESLAPVHTHIDNEDLPNLSPELREYLLQRHGTLELDPIPDMSDADPYNFPQSRKVLNLALVAFHAMMATFTASSIQSAFESIAEVLNVCLTRASYLTSLFIAILGAAPLFWRPLSDRFGRRPVFLISLICSLVGNIGCADSPTYATMALCRGITAFFISPAAAIGSAAVVECFFKKDRARYMGVWTLLVTLGVPMAPFLFGFVTVRVGYRWIYYILAITNGIQFPLYLFLGPETRYLRSGVQHVVSSIKQKYFTFHPINPKPLTWIEFVQPLVFFARPKVVIPAVVYSMVFLFGSVLITVEVPQLFAEKCNFNPQQLGLQFLSTTIGSVVGEQIGGHLSDWWMAMKNRKLQKKNTGILLTICGVVVFLARIEQAPALHWNITPLIGSAISSAGNQIVTTIMNTYAVDCYKEEAAGEGVFITFVRQTWGFIGPFWLPPMFTNVEFYRSAGIAAALLVGYSLITTILL